MDIIKRVKSKKQEYIVKFTVSSECTALVELYDIKDKSLLYEYCSFTSNNYIDTIKNVIGSYENTNYFKLKELEEWDGVL